MRCRRVSFHIAAPTFLGEHLISTAVTDIAVGGLKTRLAASPLLKIAGVYRDIKRNSETSMVGN